ncbi:MAG: sodium:calcium antiporter, partial [Desulfovibrionaceae bacterium]|nr:sodium:calcium antiporter [Desulfovibrionaceae bacterium]
MALDLAKFLLGAFALWFCANWIVDSASALARRWGVSELAIGLTVVAVGTSAPEFVVTLNAAFKGLGDISLSNVVGSNIFNLGFILGTMAMIRPLATHRTLVLRDGALLLAVTGFILVSALTTGLSRATGIVLVLFLAGYVLWLMSRPRVVGRASGPGLSRAARWWDWPRLLLAFAGLALGGELVVGAAVGLAQDLGLSRWAIGVTMVAAGTSLPELVTSLAA